jgi:membrane protein YdbS with pleckstrin-like domain
MSTDRPASSEVNINPLDPAGNVAAAHDQETVFFEGSPKLRGEFGLLFKCLLGALFLIAIPIITKMARFNGAPWWLWTICILLAIAVLILPMLLVRKNRYRISNYRIDHEEGLLSKRIDTIELWHVDDIDMQQGLIDRMMGVGTITIRSNDATTPILPLRSLPEPRRLLDAIKQRIIAVKRQRGVVKFDGGMGGMGSSIEG